MKAKALLDEHRRGARPLVRLVEHPERFLNPVLLLVLICQLVSATLVGVLAAQWFGAWASWRPPSSRSWSSSSSSRRSPRTGRCTTPSGPPCSARRWSPRSSASRRCGGVSAVLIGLANLLIGRGTGDEASASAGVTESELLAMADVAHAEDVIETEERAFIHSIIDFGDTVVREVMVPRPDMVTLEADRRR